MKKLIIPVYKFTLDNNDAFRGVGSTVVGGNALVLAGVAGLRVDDLNGDDAVGVSNGILGRVELLASLHPFDLKNKLFHAFD